jgi:hypothetical protein
MIETINKLIRTSRQLVQELGREPTSEEIAKRMDIPVAKVRKVLKIAQEPISLETPIGEEEDSHLGDFIEDRGVVSPAEAVINVNLKDQTSQVLRDAARRKSSKWLRLEDQRHTLEESASRSRLRANVSGRSSGAGGSAIHRVRGSCGRLWMGYGIRAESQKKRRCNPRREQSPLFLPVTVFDEKPISRNRLDPKTDAKPGAPAVRPEKPSWGIADFHNRIPEVT